MRAGLTIGELARTVQVKPKTIRYYEQVGLLPKPRRSESGYRLYSPEQVERLQLIRRAKLLGLSLGEIKETLEYILDGRCHDLQHHLEALVEAKLGEIDRRMQELSEFRDYLTSYRQRLLHRVTGEKESVGGTGAGPCSPCACLGDEGNGSQERAQALDHRPWLGPGQGEDR